MPMYLLRSTQYDYMMAYKGKNDSKSFLCRNTTFFAVALDMFTGTKPMSNKDLIKIGFLTLTGAAHLKDPLLGCASFNLKCVDAPPALRVYTQTSKPTNVSPFSPIPVSNGHTPWRSQHQNGHFS